MPNNLINLSLKLITTNIVKSSCLTCASFEFLLCFWWFWAVQKHGWVHLQQYLTTTTTTTLPIRRCLLLDLWHCPDTLQVWHRRSHQRAGRKRCEDVICTAAGHWAKITKFWCDDQGQTVLLYLLHQTEVSLKGKPLELKMNFTVWNPLQTKPLQEQENV